MSESSEVVGGGMSVATVAAAPEVSTTSTLVEEGGEGTSPEDAPLGPEGSTLKWAALCLRKVAPKWATTWSGSPEGKSAKPRNKKKSYEWK